MNIPDLQGGVITSTDKPLKEDNLLQQWGQISAGAYLPHIQLVEGDKMFKNRLFNILIGIALVTLVALTAREDFAITSITSQTDTSIKCSSLPSRFSIRTGHVNESALDIGKGFVDGNESFFTFIELYIQN